MKSRLLFFALVFMIVLPSVLGIRTFERTDLRTGVIYRVEVDQANLALTHNYFSLTRPLPWLNLTMQKITQASAPSNISNAYGYFRIAPEGMTNRHLKNAEIEFKIPLNWFKDNNHTEDIVSLNIYDEYGIWQRLPTERVGSIDGDLYFRSNTANYGYFAITVQSKYEFIEEPEVTEVPEEPEPIRLAPRKTLIDLIKQIPDYVYLIIIGAFVLISAVSYTWSTLNKMKHPYPELTRYVRSSLGKGAELSEIKRVLLDAGWPRDIVNKELKMYMPSEEYIEAHKPEEEHKPEEHH
ncbi:PGF-pre-PGF domain-containing protein [Candidatus Woesearchaeota archaeon]|nr:PGF-pre-PGF domain-containing protein [Candidatus Woesearchaeota archaeon]